MKCLSEITKSEEKEKQAIRKNAAPSLDHRGETK